MLKRSSPEYINDANLITLIEIESTEVTFLNEATPQKDTVTVLLYYHC